MCQSLRENLWLLIVLYCLGAFSCVPVISQDSSLSSASLRNQVRYIAPEIICTGAVIAREDEAFLKPERSFTISVLGLRVDTLALRLEDGIVQRFGLPFSAITSVTASIDYNAPSTNCRIYRGSKAEKHSFWVPTGYSFELVKTSFDTASGNIRLHFAIRDLPVLLDTLIRQIGGSIALRCSISVKVPETSMMLHTASTCVLPVNIAYKPVKGEPEAIQRIISHSSILCKDCSEEAAKYASWHVTSPQLKKEVYGFFLRLGRKFSHNHSALPLVVNGTAKRNGKFDINTIRLGTEVVTRFHIVRRMSEVLYNRLSEPLAKNHQANYPFRALSQSQQAKERKTSQNLAHQKCLYEGKDVLQNIDFYLHAGYAIFQADSALVTYISTILTPVYPPRTKELDAAERDCPQSQEIQRRAKEDINIPEVLIHKDGKIDACELVKRYYSQVMQYIRIGDVYAIVNFRDSVPEVMGIAGIVAPPKWRQNFHEDFVRNSLNGPISSAVLTKEDLMRFPTTYQSKGQNVVITLAHTKSRNLYEYCQAGIMERRFVDCTASIMPFPAVRQTIKPKGGNR